MAGDTGWRLREARTDDVPDLVRLARAFYDEDGFTTGDDDLETNFRALFALGPAAHLSIGAQDGRAMGFALTTCQVVLESGVVAELQDLYVEPEHRGDGVGGALMDDAAQWARSRGAALLEVVVAPNGRDVATLLAYYAARGFRDEGRRLLSLVL